MRLKGTAGAETFLESHRGGTPGPPAASRFHTHSFSHVGAHSMRPPGFAPGTPGDREGRPYGDIRTGSVGSANSGAELEAHRKQILQTQGPVARREIRHSLKFCAPEMAQYLSGGAPVNGVRGARLGAPERCSSEQTPAAFCPIPRGSRRSPAKRVRREEEEQGNERSFRR